MKIKNVLLAIISALTVASCTGASKTSSADNQESSEGNHKAIVCYFSATGTTKAQAQRLADMIGADVYEITPAELYTEADLDWHNKESRSSVEMKDKQSRPALGGEKANLADYDIVFVGYPNWWNTAPRIINTFIESNDFDGKTIVPFMTSGGSDIENSEKELAEAYPNFKFAKGLLMNDVTDKEIIEWVRPLGINAISGK